MGKRQEWRDRTGWTLSRALSESARKGSPFSIIRKRRTSPRRVERNIGIDS